MSRALRWLAIALCSLATILIVGSGGLYLWLRTGLPKVEGEIAVSGLSAPAEIARDTHGVPFIRAASEADAAFALGFVHAQDRLWQMEAMRRIGAGRLSEVVGTRTVELDRFMRTLGLYRLAESALDGLAPETRAALDAYAAGVNAFLATRRGALPPEFVLLSHAPEPWKPADSLVWGKLMAMQLSGDWRSELLRLRLLSSLSREEIERLWPSDSFAPPTTLASAAKSLHAWTIPEIVAPFLGGGASNSWVVAGSRTETGKPILANDPHLGAQLPSQWYLARLSAAGIEVGGATAPGVPFVILGHNASLAWGFTSSQTDVEDLVVETLDGDRYKTPMGPRSFETRTETIRVSGGADVVVTIRATRHGPVISDAFSKKDAAGIEDKVLALAAPYLAAQDRSANAIRLMGRARDGAELDAWMEDFEGLQQFVLHGEADGGIGFVAPGRIPIRAGGDGFWPADGASSRGTWTGFIPYDDLPRAIDPPGGAFFNANNRPVGQTYPYFLARTWEEPYRARRIQDLLEKTPHRVADSKAMQADILSLAALDLVPELLRQVERSGKASTPADQAVIARLASWDGRMDANRPEPLVFTAWMRALTRQLFEDDLGADFAAFWDTRPRLLLEALGGAGGWCDDRRTPDTESCAPQTRDAFDDAMAELRKAYGQNPETWRWGDAHQVQFRHLILGRIPVIGSWLGKRVETGGDAFTLLRGGSRFSDAQPYRAGHIASLRAIYDLSDMSRSQFLIATGQSGHPLSPHFLDFAVRWRDFDYVCLPASVETARAEGGKTLRLIPAR